VRREEKKTNNKRVVQPRKQALLSRLNRIEGQIKGIARMIEEDRYCVDVLTQISAASAAIDGVAMRLLDDHTRGCVQKAIRDGEGEQSIDELLAIVKKLRR
jgi:DNA-binding FrmR family transcriptional regulator